MSGHKLLKKRVIHDPVHPGDFMNLRMAYACEHCSHFSPAKEICTLGYESRFHRQEVQLKTYELSGKMIFCRFLEID